ncbi:DUF2218 domain-containing protein [Micromonospora sp. I033]
MPVLQAQIQTDRATRYLVQFCKHAAAMGGGVHSARMRSHMRRGVQVAAEWTDIRGTVTFDAWGRAELTADGNSLTVRIEAADEDRATQIRDIITRDLERFSRRDPLAIAWQRLESTDAAARREAGSLPSGQRRPFTRSRLQTAALALAVVLVVALHVGLAGSVVAQSRSTGLAANAVVALIALKIAMIAVARFKIRQRRATRRPDHT